MFNCTKKAHDPSFLGKLGNHTRDTESISSSKGYEVVALKRWCVNLIIRDICNRTKEALDSSSLR